MIQKIIFTLGFIGSVCSAIAQDVTESNINEYRLKNGLKVVVKEDHRAPVVISQLWYRIGSADEYNGITGVSHVLEHMMFKGTSRYPNGRFSAIIAENGGRENAFTTRDQTAYYQILEKSRLGIAFELEADRMRNLTLAEEDFLKELEVVKEERRLRIEDNPNALSYEQLYATAFNNNPYRNPVIGWMEDLKAMQINDIKNWYRSWYTPNNAILVVVGDVDPQEVYRLAEKYYGEIVSTNNAVRKPRREPPQRGERRVTVKAPARLPYLIMGYKVPTLTKDASNWEPYALEVLAGILDGGRSSRFSKHLVREQEVAASAGAGYGLYGRYGDLFLINGTPAQGHDVKELELALTEQIDKLHKIPIRNEELNRVKAQVVAGEVFDQDSAANQASQIGTVETLGLSWKVLKDYVKRVQAVTAEQVQEVAQKYLIKTQRTVVVLEPLPINPSQKTSRFGHFKEIRG